MLVHPEIRNFVFSTGPADRRREAAIRHLIPFTHAIHSLSHGS
jgi:hypothetical protein